MASITVEVEGQRKDTKQCNNAPFKKRAQKEASALSVDRHRFENKDSLTPYEESIQNTKLRIFKLAQKKIET